MNTQTKQCPYCGETIMASAKKCRYCGEWLNETPTPEVKPQTEEGTSETEEVIEEITQAKTTPTETPIKPTSVEINEPIVSDKIEDTKDANSVQTEQISSNPQKPRNRRKTISTIIYGASILFSILIICALYFGWFTAFLDRDKFKTQEAQLIAAPLYLNSAETKDEMIVVVKFKEKHQFEEYRYIDDVIMASIKGKWKFKSIEAGINSHGNFSSHRASLQLEYDINSLKMKGNVNEYGSTIKKIYTDDIAAFKRAKANDQVYGYSGYFNEEGAWCNNQKDIITKEVTTSQILIPVKLATWSNFDYRFDNFVAAPNFDTPEEMIIYFYQHGCPQKHTYLTNDLMDSFDAISEYESRTGYIALDADPFTCSQDFDSSCLYDMDTYHWKQNKWVVTLCDTRVILYIAKEGGRYKIDDVVLYQKNNGEYETIQSMIK